ncbi:non-ribosomal peptide synthetase [Streptomyces sp. NRRL B-1347]|uniref:non-ribosomal peptide synthetase n=1 Tax=Streptomyces sp. NRRL B-1347 TaxID=1476877 RepID=UPI00068CFB64|nr:non-ribosomal peptide synthetase [Streptomyces sp. NRRL B-1347]
MSDVQSLLAELRASGTRLWVHEGSLRYRAPEPLAPAVLAALRNARTEILQALSQDRTTLTSRPRPARVPLSLGQEGLWYIDQLGAHDMAYNVRTDLRLQGDLDEGALRRALGELVRRHESLRTRYVSENGVGHQIVDPPGEVPMDVTDLTQLPPDRRADRLTAVSDAHTDHRFDLATDPSLRVHLVRNAPTDHVLVVTVPHIGIDGPSTAIMFDELSTLYRAHAEGRTSPLPPPVAQYADYAVWQREWAEGPDYARQLRYWKERLAGAAPLLDMPTDRSRPAVPTQSGDMLRFSVPPELAARLEEFRKQHDATLYMVLLAAFHATLAKWTRQSDICVGFPVDARTHDEAASLIGYFVNTVVLRCTVERDSTFLTLLDSVRSDLLGAYDHRDLPIGRLVAELAPAREAGAHPLFQVLSAHLTPGEHRLGDLRVTELDTGDRTAKFDLTFVTEEIGPDGSITAGLEYATELFDRSTIEGLADGILTLLDRLTGRPNTPLRELSMLPDARLADRVAELSRAQPHTGDDACLHHLVERSARRTPDAIAVVDGEERLTYRDLDDRADRVAALLRERGIGPEQLVGVFLGRSATMVVALLAVLKAGGAYLPLDPEYPRARVQDMLQDSGARVVVTASDVVDRLERPAAELLLIDEPFTVSAEYADPGVSGVTGVTPDNAAYCLYTSGSTGRPKGVVLRHENAVAFVRWAATSFTGEELARVLFSTSISFDLSVFELFAPLSVGGTAILADNALDLLESDAGDTTVASGAPTDVSMLNIVPSVGRVLSEAGRIPPDVRVINLAGEALRAEIVAQLRRLAPRARINNLYGPTEYTTYATGREVTTAERITIGGPLPGTQALVLDDALSPVPVGVVGELYLAGPGLARGYWHRPGMTAEKFLPNPYGPPGSRMYRTGDLVRSLPGGELDFRGRLDHQVKVRGYRVEPGEIETVLLSSPQVKDAVVVVDSAGTEEARLIAYVVAAPDAEPDLARRMAERLPAFMAASTIVFLDRLPLTANGKVDRRSLPAPQAHPAETSTDDLPRDEVEAALLDIWSDVLGGVRIGIRDSFFEAGGHSLLATQTLSRIRRTLGIRLSLTDILTAPTVDQLAAVLRDKGAAAPGTPLRPDTSQDPFAPVLPINPSGSRPPLFCFHPALGLSLPYAGLATHLGPDRPVLGLQSPDIDASSSRFPTSVEEVAEEYVGRIREIRPHGPYHLLGWSFGGLLAFEAAVRLQAAGEAVTSLTVVDSRPAVAGEQPPSESQLLTAFLDHAGVVRSDAALTPEVALALARGEGSRLAGIGERHLERMLAVMRNNAALAQRYVPGCFTGSIRLFVGTKGATEDELQARAQAWAPHVGDAVRVSRIAFRHEELMDPQPRSEIAAVLLTDLEAAERGRWSGSALA